MACWACASSKKTPTTVERSVVVMNVLLVVLLTKCRWVERTWLHPLSLHALARLAQRGWLCLCLVIGDRLLRSSSLLLRLELRSSCHRAFPTIEPLTRRLLPSQSKGQGEGNGNSSDNGPKQLINERRGDLQLLQRDQHGKADDGKARDGRKQAGVANLGARRRSTHEVRHHGGRQGTQEEHQDRDEDVRDIGHQLAEDVADGGNSQRVGGRHQENEQNEPEHNFSQDSGGIHLHPHALFEAGEADAV